MGMYDELRVSEPYKKFLDEKVRDALFQTKSLERELSVLEIDETGHLSMHPDFNKEVVFYTIHNREDNPEWFEYRASFQSGVVTSIVRVIK